MDFGEQAPIDGVYHDGTPGHRMRNRYPLLYNPSRRRSHPRDGPTWLDAHSPIDQFPLYQRAAALVPLGPAMAHVGARPNDELTLRAGSPTTTADWRGVARVDGHPVTITTAEQDPTVVVEGLPPGVEVQVVDGSGGAVDRPIQIL